MTPNKKLLRVYVLNLPHKQHITRRFMCTYESPTSLFPPLELLSVAAVCQKHQCETTFSDAIAENNSLQDILEKTNVLKPDLIISLIGLESFEDDLSALNEIKIKSPQSRIVAFGHFPSLFPESILDETSIDAVILGEPERALSSLLEHMKNDSFQSDFHEFYTAFSKEHAIFRARNITELPMPAHEFLKADLYYETFMPGPFAMIQTARGCPYECNYCVKSFGYGNKLSMRSAEQVVEEIMYLKTLHKIKSFRIIDDTFTVNKKRVIDICKLLIEKKANLSWTCLSRTDNIHEEMLFYMKKAGCKRIYFGVESGSQKMLDFYQKDIHVDEALKSLLLTRKNGIETVGFFLLGLPNETEEDFKQSVQFALDARLSMAAVEGIVLYPGTALYDQYKDQIEFSLRPYINQFKDPMVGITHESRKKAFNKAFYMRAGYLGEKMIYGMNNLKGVGSTFQKILHTGVKNFKFMPGIKNG